MIDLSAPQRTLAQPLLFAGVGGHSGARVRVVCRPAAADHGIVFVRTDLPGGPRVPASGLAVSQTRLGTVLSGEGGATVSTVEHFLAALAGLGVDNLLVEIEGPELPLLDGAAEAFVALLDGAGLQDQAAPRRWLEMLHTVEVRDGDKRASLSPCERFEVAFAIDFASPVIGRQSIDLAVDEASFRGELAACRTFGFMHELDALRAAGLALSDQADAVLVIDGDRVVNPEGLRRPDEFVRHKALDAVGDLSLLGAPVLGRYEGERSGHGLNNALVRAVLGTPSAWRWRTAAADAATVPTALPLAG